MDIAVGLVKFFFFFLGGGGGHLNDRRTLINPAHQNHLFSTFRLVHASHSLPKWQAVKLTLFTSCKVELIENKLKDSTVLSLLYIITNYN